MIKVSRIWSFWPNSFIRAWCFIPLSNIKARCQIATAHYLQQPVAKLCQSIFLQEKLKHKRVNWVWAELGKQALKIAEAEKTLSAHQHCHAESFYAFGKCLNSLVSSVHSDCICMVWPHYVFSCVSSKYSIEKIQIRTDCIRTFYLYYTYS